MVFFIGYDAFMILRSVLVAARRAVRRRSAVVDVASRAAATGRLRRDAAAPRRRATPTTPYASVGAGAGAGAACAHPEADALAIITYFGVAIFAHGAATKTTGLRVTAITNAA